MKKDTVIAVIPVYNEDQCIEQVISDWGTKLTELKLDFKILIVNDGSTDNTPVILDKLAKTHPELEVLHQVNGGHGSAVKNGYIHALSYKTEYIFQTDSDNQFTPDDFEKLWVKRKDSPAVFGYRMDRKDPGYRKVISFFLKKRILDFFQVDIPDANIPYRLFRSDFLRSMLSVLNSGLFAPNIFLSILSFRILGSCPVIGVQHFDRGGTEAKLIRWSLVKGCMKSLWELIVFSYQVNSKLHFLQERELYSSVGGKEDLSSPMAA